MRGLPLIVSVGGVLAISACARPQPVHGQAYYLTHPSERTAAIAECKNNPGELEKTPSCISASSAAADFERKRFWAIKQPKSRLASPGSL